MTDLSSLIARLEKAVGPNREIDRDIALTVDGFVYEKRGEDAKPWFYHSSIGGRRQLISLYSSERLPAYTSSIDAAVSLAERVLPGWMWGITQGDEGVDAAEFQGNVWPGAQPFPSHLETYGYHRLPAISLVLATLRALQQKGSSNG